MGTPRYSFDVETRHGGRWLLDITGTQEHQARKRATVLFANPKCAGVRIIRTWTRPDGVAVDTEIFCETREVKDGTTLKIQRLDTIDNVCRTPEDFLGFESRQTMSRIFRAYLAKALVTPTEILHDAGHFRHISEKDGLLREAVDMVASLQPSDGGQVSKARRDEIYTAIEALFARIRSIDVAGLPKLEPTIGAVMRSFGPEIVPGQGRTLLLAALTRDLWKRRGWLDKLDFLCGMAEAESEPAALDLLDGVIADVLATDVIDDLLGPRPNLGARIRALFDLADGIAPPATQGNAAPADALCRLLAAGKLTWSRRCISGRAYRALSLPQPLKPNDPDQELAELQGIIARVVTPGPTPGAAERAHALTIRFARSVEQGGKPGRRAAIGGVFQAMPDRARGVLYLCDAARSDLGREHLPDMEALLEQALEATTMAAFCSQDLDIRQRLACATTAHQALANSPFSSQIKARLADHIDNLLEHFVISEKIIEKLDQSNSHLRDRAFRLIRFCCSGLLPDGKALTQARARVLALLKQPDFPSRFVAGLNDPEAAQTALRDFFALLKTSGVQNT